MGNRMLTYLRDFWSCWHEQHAEVNIFNAQKYLMFLKLHYFVIPELATNSTNATVLYYFSFSSFVFFFPSIVSCKGKKEETLIKTL